MTVEEWNRYGSNLASLARTYGIKNPPEVAVKAWVKPEDELAYVNPCVQSQGFELQGSTFVNIPADQNSQFDADMYKCMAAYPEMPKYTEPLTSQNLKNVYRWTVTKEIPCLKKHGYKISGVPSESVFVANYDSSPFYPYTQLHGLSDAQSALLNTECPQWPPAQYLYGY